MGRKARGAAPQQQDLSLAAEDAADPRPVLWPVTPLGIPNVPPPLPPLPDCVLTPAAMSVPTPQMTLDGRGFGPGALPPQAFPADLPHAGEGMGGMVPPPLPPLPDCISIFNAPLPPGVAAGGPLAGILGPSSLLAGGPLAPPPEAVPRKPPPMAPGDDFDIQARTDRRTFFHTSGKVHTFAKDQSRVNQHHEMHPDDRKPIGERMRLKVEDIHFANPRVKTTGPPAPLKQMITWGREQFEEFVLDVAQVSLGTCWVWAANGISSNRILYAAKRQKVPEISAVVVEAPPRPEQGEPGHEDAEMTYGATCQGIQLVP